MMKKIVSWVLLFIFGTVQAMDIPVKQLVGGSKDLNRALLVVSIRGNFDQDTLKHIENLLNAGADPNFVLPKYRTTPLMRAVCMNSPHLVTLLLDKGAKVNVSNSDDVYVRDCNLIYSKHNLIFKLGAITNRMLQVEKHNNIFANKKISCEQQLYHMAESEELRKALLIDKILEAHKAYSDIIDRKNLLFNMILHDSRIMRALHYVLGSDRYDLTSSVPENILGALFIPRRTRSLSTFDTLF